MQVCVCVRAQKSEEIIVRAGAPKSDDLNEGGGMISYRLATTTEENK